MRVLVVDDDEDLRSVVTRALRADGHVVTTAADLQAARDAVLVGTDLIVLDLGLPDGSGLDLCRALRAKGASTPILVLTAFSQVSVRVRGFDAGADDYLAKPFAVAELRARVRALGRRGAWLRSVVFRAGDVQLDFAGRRAMAAGQDVAITAKEWAILEVLVRRPGGVVSRFTVTESETVPPTVVTEQLANTPAVS